MADAPWADELDQWMRNVEGESLEFKEAKGGFSQSELGKYVCAIANEGGGRVILGVTNLRPRRIVGTKAFEQIEAIRRWLMDHIPLRIDVYEIQRPEGRVLVFEVPPRPVGTAMKFGDVYWSRHGDSLDSLSGLELRRVFSEAGDDFSATVCDGATLRDLVPESVEDFKHRWIAKSGNEALAAIPDEQLLRDAELLTDDGLTHAALVLFGSHDALGRLLPAAEVVFEYRSSSEAGPAQERRDYREGFFAFYDDLWNAIALRNDKQHYQEGFFVYDIQTLDERTVREAVLNAVSHRDYQLAGSVFVRQYPRHLRVESPGGLPLGVTVDNILDRQSPRNRRIAEALGKCGLVERSGQGMNLMFEESIKHGKERPDFSGTDDFHVQLTLHGEVTDPRFVQFLERVAEDTGTTFNTHDLMVLDLVHRGEAVPAALAKCQSKLRELGVIETVGRGRGTHYFLSQRFYTAIGQRGTYTRRRGLDRGQNKSLLLNHLQAIGARGCAMAELKQVLPARSRKQILQLLGEMRDEGVVRLEGEKRGARWVAVDPGGA